MEKKKILIAVHQMNTGGVQKSLLSALRAIDYDRYDITLYIRKDRCELLKQVDPRVGSVIVNRDPTRYYRKPKAVFFALMLQLTQRFGGDGTKWKDKLDRFVIEGRMRYEAQRYFSDGAAYDTAVSYIQSYTAAFVAGHVPAGRKVMFFHGSVDENHALHEKIFPQFEKIVAVNAGCRDVLQGLYPAFADKMTYIENYVDPAAITAAAKEYEVKKEDGKTVLCTCGRFSPEKGFELAVGAAAILKARGLDFIWYFIGDGPERNALVSAVQAAGLGEQIRMTGILTNPYPYINACDIYVQPSKEESYGLAVKEAMLLARPVVSTETAGGKSLIADGETGLIARINAADIADTISRLSADTALQNHIRDTLAREDRKEAFSRYRDQWTTLLSPDKEGSA